MFQYLRIDSIIYGISLFFIKLSILLQYLDIFRPTKKTSFMYWGPHSLIWINLALYTISSFLEIFPCNPIAKFWDLSITNGSCIDYLALNIVTSSINSVSDLCILALPQVTIWRLQISIHKKVAISAVFSIGIL